jgi:large subunit ribosomal protein L14
MIQMHRLDVADNTGAKSVQRIKALGGSKRRYAGRIGTARSASKKLPRVKKGECVQRRRRSHRQGRAPPHWLAIRFRWQRSVTVQAGVHVAHLRYRSRELRTERFMKIVSLAPRSKALFPSKSDMNKIRSDQVSS